MSLFRRSKTPSLVEGPPSDVKAGRFSFRPGSRRPSGAVFDPAAFAAPKANTDGRDNSSLGVERGRALSTLEGARRPLTSSWRPSVNTAFPAAQPESGRSSDEARMRSNMSSPPLGLVPEDAIPSPLGSEVDEHGLPTYASAAFPPRAVTYRFSQCSPFAMTLSGDSDTAHAFGQYHISIGANVWMPKSCITSVRRGLAGDGEVVAQIELGSPAAATITMGDVCRPLKEVVSKSLSNSVRLYRVGNGTTIKWKLSGSSWQAHLDNTLLATFSSKPPRKLVLEPIAHRWFDHIVVGVLVLMRETNKAELDDTSSFFPSNSNRNSTVHW